MLTPMARSFLALSMAAFSLLACSPAAEAKEPAKESAKRPTAAPLDFKFNDITGKAVDLKSYRGQTVLIVNVASECGYTPQYAELQQLYTKYKDKGFVVLGFPSNDWGGQEPGDGAAIQKFARDEYGVTFPLMEKVHTTGKEIAPLYATLEKQKGAVGWNFTKYLIDPQGVAVAKFDSAVAPLSPELTGAIEKALPPKKG